MGIETFLKSQGFSLPAQRCKENDGYMSRSQKKQFSKQLLRYPDIRRIAEIGFNAGHSAEHFFAQCPNLELLLSFDLNLFPCTKHAVRYFYQTYPNRFASVPGDSLVTIPELHQKHPSLFFDLIYIDGCHRFEWALGDILNAKKIAHDQTIVWIDDVNEQNEVAAAVKFLESIGIIHVEERFSSTDPDYGPRNWIQAKFTNFP
jgi:hypothetical protein